MIAMLSGWLCSLQDMLEKVAMLSFYDSYFGWI
jgi:hypothetical protein